MVKYHFVTVRLWKRVKAERLKMNVTNQYTTSGMAYYINHNQNGIWF